MSHQYKFPKQGQSIATEDGGKGSSVPLALYRHPDTKKEAIVKTDPLFGNSQANAFEQVGYEFIREASHDEVVTVEAYALDANKVDSESMKGVNARLSQLEGVAEQNELLKKQLAEATAQRSEQPATQAEISGDLAKQSAVDQTNARGQGDSEVVLNEDKTVSTVEDVVDEDESDESEDDEGSEEEVKPLTKNDNREKWNAHAESVGVEDPSNLEKYKTKADLIAAVQAQEAANAADEDQESEKE